jgi:hypothetical protein
VATHQKGGNRVNRKSRYARLTTTVKGRVEDHTDTVHYERGSSLGGFVEGDLLLRLERSGEPRKRKAISLARTSIERKP